MSKVKITIHKNKFLKANCRWKLFWCA